MKKILLFIICVGTIFGESTSVKIYIDSPRFLVNPAINSSKYKDPFGASDDTLLNTQIWEYDKPGDFTGNRRLRNDLGFSAWDTVSDAPSDIITELGRPIAGKYARFQFWTEPDIAESLGAPGQGGRYSHSFNWKTSVGPLDETIRNSAAADCGIDLPRRFSKYGIPEIIKVCDTLGSMPIFVYTRNFDTTYCINDKFEYIDTCYYIGWTWICDTVPITRKSLIDDALDFAEYLFGDGSSGWGKLREDYDGLATVNTDRIMVGNDFQVWLPWKEVEPTDTLYKYSWPKIKITRALFPESLYTNYSDTIISEYNYRYMIRHKARLDSVASVFKSVKSDLKVGAFIQKPDFRYGPKTHKLMNASALSAEYVDYLGFHCYYTGGHEDGDKRADSDREYDTMFVRLNYTNTDRDFMQDFRSVEDSSKNFANRFLLNESLGDLGMNEYVTYTYDALPIIKAWIDDSLCFWGSNCPSSKPLEITEYNTGTRPWFFENDGYFSKRITVGNAIKISRNTKSFECAW